MATVVVQKDNRNQAIDTLPLAVSNITTGLMETILQASQEGWKRKQAERAEEIQKLQIGLTAQGPFEAFSNPLFRQRWEDAGLVAPELDTVGRPKIPGLAGYMIEQRRNDIVIRGMENGIESLTPEEQLIFNIANGTMSLEGLERLQLSREEQEQENWRARLKAEVDTANSIRAANARVNAAAIGGASRERAAAISADSRERVARISKLDPASGFGLGTDGQMYMLGSPDYEAATAAGTKILPVGFKTLQLIAQYPGAMSNMGLMVRSAEDQLDFSKKIVDLAQARQELFDTLSKAPELLKIIENAPYYDEAIRDEVVGGALTALIAEYPELRATLEKHPEFIESWFGFGKKRNPLFALNQDAAAIALQREEEFNRLLSQGNIDPGTIALHQQRRDETAAVAEALGTGSAALDDTEQKMPYFMLAKSLGVHPNAWASVVQQKTNIADLVVNGQATEEEAKLAIYDMALQFNDQMGEPGLKFILDVFADMGVTPEDFGAFVSSQMDFMGPQPASGYGTKTRGKRARAAGKKKPFSGKYTSRGGGGGWKPSIPTFDEMFPVGPVQEFVGPPRRRPTPTDKTFEDVAGEVWDWLNKERE